MLRVLGSYVPRNSFSKISYLLMMTIADPLAAAAWTIPMPFDDIVG